MLLMVDTFSAWVFGNFAGALFLVAASTALLGDERPPRWLIRGGFTAAGAGLLGSLWVVDGNTDGPLFGIGVLSRAMFLAWVAAAGIWLHRTAVSADSAPDRVAAVPTA